MQRSAALAAPGRPDFEDEGLRHRPVGQIEVFGQGAGDGAGGVGQSGRVRGRAAAHLGGLPRQLVDRLDEARIPGRPTR